MSATTVERTNLSWRKRGRQEEATDLQIEMKRPRYYYRLESESSRNSEEDTESIYSLQDHETDVVRDTSDTDSKSESDAGEYEYEIEYEVASLSESDHAIFGNSTSDSDDHVIFAAAIGAMCDSSLETWITDCEESDNSSLDDSVVTRLGFSTCVQCKSQNDNPLYRYCEKCFQDRKKLYPPRPRGNKKPKKKSNDPPVKLDTLRSCLSGLSSQDSGLGSSQECPPLDLDQIVVPDQHFKPGTSEISTDIHKENASKDTERELKRKRQASESSLSDYDIKKPKFTQNSVSAKNAGFQRNTRPTSRISEENHATVTRTNDSSRNSKNRTSNYDKSLSQISTETTSQTSEASLSLSQKSTETSLSLSEPLSQTSEKSLVLKSTNTKLRPMSQASDGGVEVSTSTSKNSTSETTELCIMCNSAPKDSIFLHTNIGHQCCCYRCAKRTLHTIKRCPICNRPVNKVIRIFQA